MSENVLATIGGIRFWAKDLISCGKFGPVFSGKYLNKDNVAVNVAVTRVDRKEFFVHEDVVLCAQGHPYILCCYGFRTDINYV